MVQQNSAMVIGIAFVASFFVALYGFLCMLSLQAYTLGRAGIRMEEGIVASFFGLAVFGAGGLVFLQCLGSMERRYLSRVKKGTVASVVAMGVGLIGYVALHIT